MQPFKQFNLITQTHNCNDCRRMLPMRLSWTLTKAIVYFSSICDWKIYWSLRLQRLAGNYCDGPWASDCLTKTKRRNGPHWVLTRSLPSPFLRLHALCLQDLVYIYKLRVISYLAHGNTEPATRYLVTGSELVNATWLLLSALNVKVKKCGLTAGTLFSLYWCSIVYYNKHSLFTQAASASFSYYKSRQVLWCSNSMYGK